MRAYYRRVLGRLPRVFRETWELVGVVLDFIIAAVLLFNQPLAQAIAKQRGFSAWWFVAPLAVLLVYGVAKANWEEHDSESRELRSQSSRLKESVAAAQATIAGHETRLRPKLHFRFEVGRKQTYYQEGFVGPVNGKMLKDRLYRVGVVNDSTAVIPGVQVLLDECSGPGDEPVYLSHRLGVMGRDEDTVDIPPGSTPTVFFDVAEQQEASDSTEPGDMFFCYSNLSLRQPLKRIQRTFTLLVQGGGVEDRISFVLGRGSDGTINMVEIQLPKGP